MGLVLELGDDLQRLGHPARSFGPGPQLTGTAQDLDPVAPLQSHPAAHAGDGIDDDAESAPRHYPELLAACFFTYWRQVTAIRSGSSMLGAGTL